MSTKKEFTIICSRCNKPTLIYYTKKETVCKNCNKHIAVYGFIYKSAIRVKNKLYVGQTNTSLNDRMNGHFSKSKSINRDKNIHFHNALKKYGRKAFDWEIIDYVELEKSKNEFLLKKELNDKEIKWIAELRTFRGWSDGYGYNLTTGGNNGKRDELTIVYGEDHGLSKLSSEIVLFIRMLKKNTGMYLIEITEEVNKLLNEEISLTNVHDVTIGKIWDQNKLKGVVLSDEKQALYEELMKKYPKNRDYFFVYDIRDCSCCGIFKNQRLVAELFEIDYRNLNSILKGLKKTANNYTAIYAKDLNEDWINNVLPKLKRNHGRPFLVYNYKNRELVGEYNNQRECSRQLNLLASEVNTCLEGRQAYHKEYIFIFKDEFDPKVLKEKFELAEMNRIKANK